MNWLAQENGMKAQLGRSSESSRAVSPHGDDPTTEALSDEIVCSRAKRAEDKPVAQDKPAAPDQPAAQEIGSATAKAPADGGHAPAKPSPEQSAKSGADGTSSPLSDLDKLRAQAKNRVEITKLLDGLEREHVQYFLEQEDPKTHLTLDRSRKDSASSIAAVGFGLTVYPIAAERHWISRDKAAQHTLSVLQNLYHAQQGDQAEGTAGNHGFFYHFLDPKAVTRKDKSELSTIDTALLMSGVLFVKNYFDQDTSVDRRIRRYATKLYDRVDWNWAMNGKDRMALDWTPEKGFSHAQWGGYNEAMMMLLLGMGSSSKPIDPKAWQSYVASEKLTDYAGKEYIAFPPMFGHQYSHAWVDFRGIQDSQNRKLGFDYFENSRRATYAQNFYARENPLHHRGYDALNWGITASDGPGDDKKFQGKYFGYRERGPFLFDDGTIAPTAALGSMPFAPELVLPTAQNWQQKRPELKTPYGFTDAFNPAADPEKPSGWVDQETLGIDQGPIVLMVENYRTGLVWDVMKKDANLRAGLKSAGFTGGWLDKK
jgi:hypothetical protein